MKVNISLCVFGTAVDTAGFVLIDTKESFIDDILRCDLSIGKGAMVMNP